MWISATSGGYVAPGASASLRVQLTAGGAGVQVQAAPETFGSVMPAGIASVTVTAPRLGALPTLLTVNVYSPSMPAMISGGAKLFVIARSGAETVLRVSFAGTSIGKPRSSASAFSRAGSTITVPSG